MKRYLSLLFGIGIIVWLLLKMALPDYSVINELYILLIFSCVVLPLYIRRFWNQLSLEKSLFSLGFLYFFIMWAIMLIGNLNYYVVQYIYPSYRLEIISANLYWMAAMILFAEGYLSYKKKFIKRNKIYVITNKSICFLFILTCLSSILLVVNIGYIPFFTDQKGVGEELIGGSILIRLWTLNILTVFCCMYMIYKKKRWYFIVPFLISLFWTLILNQRMLLFATLVGCFLILIFYTKNIKRIVLLLLMGIFAYMFVNTSYLRRREKGQEYHEVLSSKKLSKFQSQNLYRTFNEYGQLARLISEYNSDYLYGTTLINLPLGFIPAFVLTPLGIVKSELQKNNSAIISAQLFNSKSSIGVRTGLMGELYLNFSFFGVVLLFLLGRFVAFLNVRIRTYSFLDFRSIIFLSIYVILLYSLIGQIDAIGSLIGTFLLFGCFLIISWKSLGFRIASIIIYNR